MMAPDPPHPSQVSPKPQANLFKHFIALPGGKRVLTTFAGGVFVLFSGLIVNIYHRYWSHGNLKEMMENNHKENNEKIERYHQENSQKHEEDRTKLREYQQDMKQTMHMMWAKGVYEELKPEDKKGKN